MSVPLVQEAAAAVLPVSLLPAAAALVADQTPASARVVADELAARLGRPLVGRHAARARIQRFGYGPGEVAELQAQSGRRGLRTAGPLLLRRLVEQDLPHRPVAACAEALVPGYGRVLPPSGGRLGLRAASGIGCRRSGSGQRAGWVV